MKRTFLIVLIFTLSLNISLSYGQNNDTNYSKRRQELSKILEDAIIAIPSMVKQRGRYVDNKDFYYLTGMHIPNSILIITLDKNLLLSESTRLNKETKSSFEIVKKEDVPGVIYKLSRNYRKIATQYSTLDFLSEWNINFNAFEEIVKTDIALCDMRMLKDDMEIKYLKKAIEITADALNEAYKYTKLGLTEKNLRSVIRYNFESNDTEEAFLQVASGPNSTNIHFGATDRVMQVNDLIVFDVGTYYNKYTSDISRTIPVSGKFTDSQTDIYNVVLKAQKKGIELTIMGNNFDDVQNEITEVLIDGLYDLKLITDKNLEWQRRIFIMHGWSHFIGLDVHDVIGLYRNKEDKTLSEGMILTVEPGLYFPENYLDKIPRNIKGMVTDEEFEKYKKKVLSVYKKYENNGVRIEDDILITEKGNVVLSKGVPKEIKEIEDLMKEKSFFNK